MRPGGGKSKGSGFERLVCEKVSLWITHDLRKDLMCRTVGSGGQFTSAINRGTQAGLAGDIRSQDPLADKLCSSVVIEAKFWRDLEIIKFLNRQGELYVALEKVKKEGVTVGKSWWLVAKQNRQKELLFMPTELVKHLYTENSKKPDLDFHLLFKGSVYLCELDSFFKQVTPEEFTL